MRQATAVLWAAVLGSTMAFLDLSVVQVALPAIQEDLGATLSELQWVVEAYALLLAALLLAGGAAGDRFGRRRVFGAGMVLFGLGALAAAAAQDPLQLILARGLQGLGAAAMVPGSLAMLSAHFHGARRGRAIGTWAAASAMASAAGPLAGGGIVDMLGWRWVFLLHLPFAAAALVLLARAPESRDDEAERLDLAGAALATLGLGGVVFALVEAPDRGFLDPAVTAAGGLGVLALAAFGAAEHRSGHPMMPLGLWRRPVFRGANLLTFLLYAAVGGVLFYLPLRWIQVHDWSATGAGAGLLPFVGVIALASRAVGGWSARAGRRHFLIAGPAVVAAGFALLVFPGRHASYWAFLPGVAALGAGMALTVAPLTTTALGAVPERHVGLASGVNNAVSRTGGLLAIALMGLVLQVAFSADAAGALEELDPEDREAVRDELQRASGAQRPETVDAATWERVHGALHDAFVAGFRAAVLLGAALSLGAAYSAWRWVDAGED